MSTKKRMIKSFQKVASISLKQIAKGTKLPQALELLQK